MIDWLDDANENTICLNAVKKIIIIVITNIFYINPKYTLTFTGNDKLDINCHNGPYFICDIKSFRCTTLQLLRCASERGLAFATLPSSSNRHSASVPACIVKTHKAVTSHGVNTSIIVGYLTASQRMNNMRRKDKQL